MTIKNYIYAGLVGLIPFIFKNDSIKTINQISSHNTIVEKIKIPSKGDGDAIDYHKSLSYQEVIKKMKVPAQVEWYLLNYMIYKQTKGVHSFKKTHENRYGDCAEATVAAAAMLSDDGYPPTYLMMGQNNSRTGHAVFYYKKNDLYGSLGINKIDCNEPKFKTLNELTKYLGYDFFVPLEVGDGVIKDWISTDENLWTKAIRKKYKLSEISGKEVESAYK